MTVGMALKIGGAAVLASALLSCASSADSEPPWVKSYGRPEAYPLDKFLSGFSHIPGKNGSIESAKQRAAADLSRQISVEIESSVVDFVSESNGSSNNELTTSVRSSSQIRLEGIQYEVYRSRRHVYAMATLERLPAALRRRKLRDQALESLANCVRQGDREAKAGRLQEAVNAYRSCRAHLSEGLNHESVASAILHDTAFSSEAGAEFSRYSLRINEMIHAIPYEYAQSLRAAAAGLAIQLSRSGVSRRLRLIVHPFTYAGYKISSAFGSELGIALETALGRSDNYEGVLQSTDRVIQITGSYREAGGAGDYFDLRVLARDSENGQLVASAEISLARAAISEEHARPPALDEHLLINATPDPGNTKRVREHAQEEKERLPGSSLSSEAHRLSSEEDSLYREGLTAWRNGDYAVCAERFENFLSGFSGSSIEYEASYGLAECSYWLSDFARSAVLFGRLYSSLPRGYKAPDTLYMQGRSLVRLGPAYYGAARAAFRGVIENFPESGPAEDSRRMVVLLGDLGVDERVRRE